MRDIHCDPHWFPDRLDWKNRLVRFVHTEHEILRRSAFLDGRTALTQLPGRHAIIGFDALSAQAAERPAMRWIFHESFCGSTLLARAITIRNHSLCLREPQILVDLANWHRVIGETDLVAYQAVVAAVVATLSRRWDDDEQIIIKPSNWVTPIVSRLARPGDRLAVVTIELEEFLIANLRGGKGRLAYTASLCRQLYAARPDLARIAESCRQDEQDKSAGALAVVTAAHWIQRQMLASLGRWEKPHIAFAFPGFLSDMPATVGRMSECLDLSLPAPAIDRSIERTMSKHSKSGMPRGAADAEEAINAVIRTRYASSLARAYAFADRLARCEQP